MLRYPHPGDALPPIEIEPDPDSAYGVTDEAHDRARALALQLESEGWTRIDVRHVAAYPRHCMADTDIVGAHVLSEVWAPAWRVELLRAVAVPQRGHAWVADMIRRSERDLELRAMLRSLVRALPPVDDLRWDHPLQVERSADRSEALREALKAWRGR